MSTAPNSRAAEQLVGDLIAAWNTHDLDLATAFFAADYEGRDVAQVELQRGPAGIRGALAQYFQAIPDVRFTLDDIVATEDRVAVVWTARGTHLGTLMNIPASGRRVTVRGASAFAIEDGKIGRATYIWDFAGLLRDIGLLPELQPPGR